MMPIKDVNNLHTTLVVIKMNFITFSIFLILIHSIIKKLRQLFFILMKLIMYKIFGHK